MPPIVPLNPDIVAASDALIDAQVAMEQEFPSLEKATESLFRAIAVASEQSVPQALKDAAQLVSSRKQARRE